MASYNAWNKVPMTVNPIIDEVVIKQWGANGIFSSDATAVEQMVDSHKYFADQPTALAAAIKAGISQILSFRSTPRRPRAGCAQSQPPHRRRH